jgi:nucleoside 2-deoxyribosyltransferase
MSKIYLAGPISGLTWEESHGWREIMEDLFFGDTLNPLLEQDKAELSDQEKSTFSDGKSLGQVADMFYARDTHWVRQCDIVLANFTNVPKTASTGTAFEVGMALALNKLIVVVGPEENVPLFVWKSADVRFEDLEGAISFLRDTTTSWSVYSQ